MQDIILSLFYAAMLFLNFRSYIDAKVNENRFGQKLSIVGIFASFWCFMGFVIDIDQLFSSPGGMLQVCVSFGIASAGVGVLLYLAGKVFYTGRYEEDEE